MSNIAKLILSLHAQRTTGHTISVLLDHKIDQFLLSGPKTCEELARQSPIDPDRLHRCLRLLETSGLFAYNPITRQWAHNHLSLSLAQDPFNSMAQWLFSKPVSDNYTHFDLAVSKNSSTFEARGLGNLFEFLNNNPKELAFFQKSMRHLTNLNVDAIVEAIDFNGIGNMMDVGGGDGTLCAALALKNQRVRFSVFDLRPVIEIARRNIESKGLSDRVGFVEGSFFETIPKGFDAISLKAVIHDWDDEKSLNLLRNIRKALEVGKTLFIVEIVVRKGDKFTTFQATQDVHMMGMVNAKERTEEEFEKLLKESGFRIKRIIPASMVSVIEAEAI
jgi:2-polyprenyl-3-methyl-5-hydroxy-6-metoxy-1,4-benzoquinol methylase